MVAYVFGHFLQAASNIFFRKRAWRPEYRVFNNASLLPQALQSALTKKARQAVGLRAEEPLEPEVIYDIADHYVLQQSKTEARDIYVYREGFYRGMTWGLLLFGIGNFFRAVRAGACLEVFGAHLTLGPATLVWAGLIAVVLAISYLFTGLRASRSLTS